MICIHYFVGNTGSNFQRAVASAIDMTVLYTALPRLTQDLEASAVQKLWIVNAYIHLPWQDC